MYAGRTSDSSQTHAPHAPATSARTPPDVRQTPDSGLQQVDTGASARAGRGSPNIAAASSNVTPCLTILVAALGGSHVISIRHSNKRGRTHASKHARESEIFNQPIARLMAIDASPALRYIFGWRKRVFEIPIHFVQRCLVVAGGIVEFVHFSPNAIGGKHDH